MLIINASRYHHYGTLSSKYDDVIPKLLSFFLILFFIYTFMTLYSVINVFLIQQRNLTDLSRTGS